MILGKVFTICNRADRRQAEKRRPQLGIADMVGNVGDDGLRFPAQLSLLLNNEYLNN